MRWRHEARLAASPDAVYAWMSDFREDDHAREAFLRGAGQKPGGAASRRTVVSRDGNRVKLRDAWGRRTFEMDVELAPQAREVRLTGEYGYRATWRAEPDGAGTRVVSEGAFEPAGLMRLVAPLFARGFARQMEQDFRGHVEDLRSELAR
jgi:Polyketide cyclase / dehydrase and lipid transport